ncbi:MAG: cytochrome P450, partial [Proteobacteria bacterium]|nr:cytochrome P450 [Pseudomonadota bacterium]
IGVLIPHFKAAAVDLVSALGTEAEVNLLDAYQGVALNAVLRSLFSMPEASEREAVGQLVRQYIAGPGRPQLFDGFAKTESSFSFALGGRRQFQKRWFAAVDGIVAARMRAPHDAAHRDLLDMLIAARDAETGAALSPEEIRDQCATMIFAGYETTARLLFWATYLLTLDRAEQERVHAEVAAFPPERVSSLEDLKRWPRLRLVLLEALRLYPPVPLLVREPIADHTIAGEHVRRGVAVYIAPWVLHRHRKFWQNPNAFIPDRFADQPSPWTTGGAYLPFGAGPRICIGAMFALAEAQIVLAAVLARNAVSLVSAAPVLPVGRLTTQPSHEPMFKLARRS